MAIENLFTTETPDGGSTDLADLGAGGHTAGSFTFGANGNIIGVRFWAPATVSAGHTFTAEVYQVTQGEGTSSGSGTGTLLGSKSVSGSVITAGTWNTINLDTPVPVTTANTYRTAIHNTAGRYVARANYYNTGHTNGNITSPQSGVSLVGGQVVRNGTYRAGSSAGQYPSNYFSTATYLIDVAYEAGAAGVQVVDTAGAATPAGTADTAKLGTVLSDLSGPATPAGSAESVAIGSVIADSSGAAAASGTMDGILGSGAFADSPGAATPAGTAETVTATAPADPSGAAAASGTPDTVIVEVVNQPDLEVWPALQTILACLTEQVALVPDPPLHVQMRPGDFVSAGVSTDGTDECCQGLAWVRVTSIVPSENFPAPAGTPSRCSAPYLALGVELGVVRCAPAGMDAKGKKLTTAAEWSASVQKIMNDAAALRRTACCVRDALDDDVIVGQWVPLPLEANCTGGTLGLTVQIRQCEC